MLSRGVRSRRSGTFDTMVTLLIILLLAALGILGAVIEGLLWLTLIAGVLLVVGLVYGWSKLKASS